MKKFFMSFYFWLLTMGVHAQCSELMLSEYIEGSSSNKAIELFNPTTTPVELKDYNIKVFTNGSNLESSSFHPGGVLYPGEVFTIVHPRANTSLVDVADTLFGWTFNGNDAIGLFRGDVPIEILGEIGSDPGSGWEINRVPGATKDHTLVKNQEGNWLVDAKDVFIDFGLESNQLAVACELLAIEDKEAKESILVKVIDVVGRDVSKGFVGVGLFVFSDGKVEKRFIHNWEGKDELKF